MFDVFKKQVDVCGWNGVSKGQSERMEKQRRGQRTDQHGPHRTWLRILRVFLHIWGSHWRGLIRESVIRLLF